MNQTNTICPLLSIAGDDLAHCQRSACAWWDSHQNQCAMLSFRDSLEFLQDVINVDVLEK